MWTCLYDLRMALEQRRKFAELVIALCEHTGMCRAIIPTKLEVLDPDVHGREGLFYFSHDAASQFICNRGLHVLRGLSSTAEMFVRAADGISKSCAERDSSNERSDELPPVFPYDLVRMKMHDFSRLVESHLPRLQKT